MPSFAKMFVGGKRNRCRLGNISDVDHGNARLAERHGVDPSLRKGVFQRCVVLAEVVWANNRERDIELPQSVFNRQLRSKVWNILEAIHSEDRVIYDMPQLQPLGQIVGDEALRQFIRHDGVQQVELIHSVQRLLYRDRIKQIADRNLNPLRRRRVFFTYKQANVCLALLQFLHNFCTNFTGAANYQNLHRVAFLSRRIVSLLPCAAL